MVENDERGGEQDVLVVLRLGNALMGTAREREELQQFGEQLAAAVEAAGVGEYDGEEFGGGQCTLFFAGPDARRLADALLPLLHKSPRCRGGKLVLQDDDAADGRREQRL